MSLWIAQRGRRFKETGKFHVRKRFGTQQSSGGQHRNWSYQLVSHSTGVSVRRTTFSVAILDPHRNRVAYLRDFSNLEQAATAAREWIDLRLSRTWPKTPDDLGAIPAVPVLETPVPELPAQEK